MTRASRSALGILSFVFCVVILSRCVQAESPRTLDQLGWLAGCWTSDTGRQHIEECWLAPDGGMMLGLNRTVRSDGRGAFEFLRIAEHEGGLAYLASPGGRSPATPFRLTALGERRAVFENPEHDFPQRLTYSLDDEGVLHARVEAEQDGEMQGFELILEPTSWPGE